MASAPPAAKKLKGLGSHSDRAGRWTEEVSTLPPNKAVIKRTKYARQSGGSSRPSLPFAMAEKVDNSISATKDNPGARTIHVYCNYDVADNLESIVFRDNGKGMDGREELEGYLELARTQEIRKKEAEGLGKVCTSLESQQELDASAKASINSNIGHHGQGGKTSAFSMGNAERVITCARKGNNRKKIQPVTEVRHIFDDSECVGEGRKTAWDFKFMSRDLGDKDCLMKTSTPAETHPVVIDLVENEDKDYNKGDGFSMFIVTDLEPETKNFLSPKKIPGGGQEECLSLKKIPGYCEDIKYGTAMQRVVEPLARIYHYYLHGKDGDMNLPDFSDDEDMSDGGDDDDEEDIGGTSSSYAIPKKRKAISHKGNPASSTKKKKTQSAQPEADKTVDIVVHAYKEDKLKYRVSLVEVKTIEVQLMNPAKILRPNNEINHPLNLTIKVMTKSGPTKMLCCLYYCPFSLNGETRPEDKYERLSTKDGVIFSMFWQGRWIPYGGEISTMPKCFENLRGNGEKPIPAELLKRLRVNIFCSRKMYPDAPKLVFVENMDQLINQDSTIYMFSWNDNTVSQLPRVRKKIADFIEDRHSRFDREITVYDVIRVMDTTDGRPITRFATMKYGKDKHNKDVMYKQGQEIKYEVHKKNMHYGRIEYFECDKLTGDRNVTSKARIWYKRLPEELFGVELISQDVSQKLSKVAGDKEAERRLESQIEKLMEQIPDTLLAVTTTVEQATGKFQKSRVEHRSVAKLFTEPVVAGYTLPLIAVYILSKDDKPLVDVPSNNTVKRPKLKVCRTIWKTHDGELGRLDKPAQIDRQTLEEANPSGAFMFDHLEDAMRGAGEYTVEFSLVDSRIDNRGRGEDRARLNSVKALSFDVKVLHAEPALADVKFLCTGENFLRLGVKHPRLFRVCLRDGFCDKGKEGNIYKKLDSLRAQSGNLVTKFPRDTVVEAVEVSPAGLDVLLLGPEPVKKEKGCPSAKGSVEFGVCVKPKDGVVFEHLQKLHAVSPMSGSFKLEFALNGQGKKFTYDMPFEFQLTAGDPRRIVITQRNQLQDDKLCIENRSFLPSVDVHLLDKYGNFVMVGGDHSHVVHVEITETLTYKGSKEDCQKRQVEEANVQITQGGTATLGKRRIHLFDPPVAENEIHEWKILAQADLKGGKTKELKSQTDDDPLTLTVTPSTLPCCARPFRDGVNEPERVNGVFRLDGEAGSEITGVFFKFFDEADNEVVKLDGWKVKWPRESKEVPLMDGVMPGYKCREQADDERELTVTFVGPQGKDHHGEKITVDLVLVPRPAGPDHWVLCFFDGEGRPLPKKAKVSFACDQPLQGKFGMQLCDRFGNAIDLRELNSKFQTPSEMIRPGIAFKWLGDDKDKAVFNKLGEWNAFDDTIGIMIVPTDRHSVRAKVGDWMMELGTSIDTKLKNGMKIERSTQKIEIRPGAPKYLMMKMKGLPNEADTETCHIFGCPKQDRDPSQDESMMMFVPPSDMIGPSLKTFPSASIVSEIQVQLLDQTGNEIDARGAKDIEVTLNLSGGGVWESEKKRDTKCLAQKFNSRSKKITFSKVVLEAGTEELTGMAGEQDKDKLVLSCSAEGIADLEVPVTFSRMNKIVGVQVSPDPYTSLFSVGDRMKKIIVVLKTEDNNGIDKAFAKGLTIKCVQDPNVEEEGVFSNKVEPQWNEEDGNSGKEFIFTPGPKTLKRTGPHWIQVIYKEERPSILDVLGPYEKKSNVLTFNVNAGIPHTLDKRAHIQSDLVANKKAQNQVSNDAHQNRMIMTKPLVLQVRDQHGNECIGYGDLCVAVSILEAKEGVKRESGDSEPHEDLGAPMYEVAYIAEFHFWNDAEDQKKLDDARAKMDADLEATLKHQAAIDTLNKDVADKAEDVRNATEKLDSLLSNASQLGLNRDMVSNAIDCQNMIEHLEKGGLADGHRHAQVPRYLRELADKARSVHGDDKVFGLLVDLIYVTDENEASIIAWRSADALETLIVKDGAVAEEIAKDSRFRTQIQVLAVDRAEKFHGNINPKEKLVVSQNSNEQWLNDRAVCNLVEFHDRRHEHLLRKTVVWNLLREYCIVNHDRNWVSEKFAKARRNGTKLPDVISKPDREKFKSNGVIGGPGAFAPDQITKNRTYPGQKPMTDSQKKYLEKVVKQMGNLSSLEEKLQCLRAKQGQEGPLLEEKKVELKGKWDASTKAYYGVREAIKKKKDRNSAQNTEAGAPEGDGDAQEGILPELDFVRPEGADLANGGGGAQDGGEGPLGKFVFPVDAKGRVTIADLGLKVNVGDKYGPYNLVCKLHKTTGEVVNRSEPEVIEVQQIDS